MNLKTKIGLLAIRSRSWICDAADVRRRRNENVTSLSSPFRDSRP